jgi:hypothetical protein
MKHRLASIAEWVTISFRHQASADNASDREKDISMDWCRPCRDMTIDVDRRAHGEMVSWLQFSHSEPCMTLKTEEFV